MDRYQKYKDSGIEWIGEVPSHWNSSPLKYVVTYNSETLAEDTDPDFRFSYIEISDVNQFSGVGKGKRISFSESPSRARRILRLNDVLVSTVRTYLKAIGTVRGVKDFLIASTGFCVLRATEKINPFFLSYFVPSEQFVCSVVAHSEGVSYPAINSTVLVRLKVLLPPLSEQVQIAKHLDRKTSQIDSLIAKLDRKIELLKENRTALISHYVTKGLNPDVEMKDSGIEWVGEIPRHWSISSLKYSLNLIMGQSPETGALNDEGKGIPFLQGCKEFGTKYPNPVQYISSPLKICNQGSILLSVRAPVGRLNYSDQNYCIGRGLCALCAIENISHIKFAKFQMEILIYELERVSSGSTYTAVTVSDIKTLFYIVVPIDEQIQIAKHLDRKTSQIDSLIAKLDRKIELHKEYRQSLISNVVTGKVRVLEFAE